MNFNDFKFNTNNLMNGNIEDKICDYTGAGYCNSSGFSPIIQSNFSGQIHIYGSEKNVDFHISVIDMNTGEYEVSVRNINAMAVRKRTR